MAKVLKWAGMVLVPVAILIQVFPRVERTNPPVTGEIEAPPEVMAILRRSCYDCHSNETRWPWYSQVAPVSWLVSKDVREARFKINFSTWAEIPSMYKVLYRGEILKQVENGAMPLAKYIWLHRDAEITPADLDTLRRWIEGD